MCLLDILLPVHVPSPKGARQVRPLAGDPKSAPGVKRYNESYYQRNKARILKRLRERRRKR